MSAPRAAISRPLAVANAVREGTLSEADVMVRRVLLTADDTALATKNGAWIYLDCVRLLARITGELVVALPKSGSRLGVDELKSLIEATHALGRVSWVASTQEVDLRGFHAILNVGFSVRADLPWSTVNSHGWLVRASSGPTALSSEMYQPNPVAALMAASIGVSEVFKRVYDLPADRFPPLSATEFSLYDMSEGGNAIGPDLPDLMELPDTVMVGAGAIGNGLALLSSQLPLRGRLHLIDCDDYSDENFGTCVLFDDHAWVGTPKARRLAEWLADATALQVTFDTDDVASARSSDTVAGMNVDLVLNGLDDVDARHDAQLMWPQILVDGGINAIGAAAITYRLDLPGAACMRCLFKKPEKDVLSIQQQASGLSRAALADLSQPLSDIEIEEAPETHKPWLRRMRSEGKTKCAVVGEAVSNRLGIGLEEGFQPSAPFIATAAACLVMSQALKSLCFPQAEYVHRLQLESLFIGPSTVTSVFCPADPMCVCVKQRAVIEKMAKRRASGLREQRTAG